MSTLSLVDLAGSESVRLANTHGQRQIEGGFINKSLLTLGKVVSMLTEDGENEKKTQEAAAAPQRRFLSFAIWEGVLGALAGRINGVTKYILYTVRWPICGSVAFVPMVFG